MDRRPDPRTPFEEFYCNHYRWVVDRAGRIVGARNAEDVAQEVFVRVALAHERGEFDLSTSASAYLRKSTYWTARDHLRRLLREQPADHDEEINPMDENLRADPERALAVRRRWAELGEMLETLRPERRIVWMMSELDAMTLAEIAAVLKISPNTVNKRLQLARAEFQAALDRKRAAENRKLAGVGALLLLPLDADAIGRTARTFPTPDAPDGTRVRLWRRIQEELARRRDGDVPGKPPPRALGPQLKPEARDFAAIMLGMVVGLLAAMVLADSHPAPDSYLTPPREADPAPKPVALASGPTVVGSPPVVGVVPTEDMNNPPPPAGSTEPELTEVRLVKQAKEALEPPNPNPEEALLLLDRYAELYPQSRRFTDVVARLRREARRLAEQKR